MFVGPDDGNTTNNTSWGIALGYNIAIYHPGVYYVICCNDNVIVGRFGFTEVQEAIQLLIVFTSW